MIDSHMDHDGDQYDEANQVIKRPRQEPTPTAINQAPA